MLQALGYDIRPDNYPQLAWGGGDRSSPGHPNHYLLVKQKSADKAQATNRMNLPFLRGGLND